MKTEIKMKIKITIKIEINIKVKIKLKITIKIKIKTHIRHINNTRTNNINIIGYTFDLFVSNEIFTRKRIKIDFSIGLFKPITWKPLSSRWIPTYSIDFKLKK